MKVPAGTWNRLAQWVTVFLLSLSLGWQWAALQSVAWAGMLVQRTRSTSFQEAWRTTFDGQHPCRLCRLVRGAVTQDQHPLNKATDEVRPLDLVGMMLCSVTAPSVQTPRPELPTDWAWAARSDPPIFLLLVSVSPAEGRVVVRPRRVVRLRAQHSSLRGRGDIDPAILRPDELPHAPSAFESWARWVILGRSPIAQIPGGVSLVGWSLNPVIL